jgi:hypothetical protein
MITPPNFLVLLVSDSEYSKSTGAKPIYLVAVFISFTLARCEQFKLACGPAYVMITRLVSRLRSSSANLAQWVHRRSGMVWLVHSDVLSSLRRS